MKTDPIFEHDRREVARLREEIKWLKKEIAMLRTANNPVKKATGPKTIHDYTPTDFCKTFQKLFKEHYSKGFHIYKWAVMSTTMKKVMQAFYDEGGTYEDVLEFLKWAVTKRTHTGSYMNIGYLNATIQDYRMHHLRKVEKQITKEIDKNKVKKMMDRRFKE